MGFGEWPKANDDHTRAKTEEPLEESSSENLGDEVSELIKNAPENLRPDEPRDHMDITTGRMALKKKKKK